MTRDAGVLVVGAGQAAVQLASSLRDGGYDRPVTLVGEEEHPPYQRPPLSKAYLKAMATPDSLSFRAPDYYGERGITLIAGDRVDGLEIGPRGAGVATCASGRTLSFGRVVLATGARARTLPLDGLDVAGVHHLREVTDAHALRVDLEMATDVVVLGGGFVGLEVAATARLLGKNVTVVEAGPSLLGRAVGPVTARHIQVAHEATGVRVLLGTTAVRLLSDGQAVAGVELSTGTTVPAQLVVVGVGATPRTELAEAAGLLCRDGVVVDELARCSDGSSLAIGDCANVPNPTAGGDPSARVRLESVDSAVEQAVTAAATLLGRTSPYRTVPWFWSDQGELKLQIAGLITGAEECVVRRYGDARKHSAFYYRQGRMVAVEAVNAPADVIAARRALAEGLSFDPESTADPEVPLKSLLCRAPTTALTG